LDAKGHPADVYYSDAAAAEIDHILADFDPHIVVMERLWLYRYIDCLKRTNCRIVLDSYNIEASVYRQIANSIAGDDLRAKLMRDALPRRTEVIEKQAVEAVDQLWVCSDEDEQIMRSLYEPSAPICVIPNGLDLDSYDGVQKKSDTGPQGASPTRKSIIFTAMFGYPPNVRAANFLIGELFPRLLAGDSSCQLLLVGAMPTSQMCAAAEKDRRIIVTGAVADVRPYIAAASVMVVPLTEGGGTRYKILEAFAARVPVVSTAVGAQGLKVKDGEHLLIAERVGDFATAIEQIVTDARLANRLTERAFELIKERYSWEFTTRSIERAIAALGVTR
jgi:glycosyltransferase involved in cell wall biosynthesis